MPEFDDIKLIIDAYILPQRIDGKWRANCPFHRDKSISFSLNTIKRTFKCRECGAWGTGVDFVSRYENITRSEAAIRLLRRNGDID
jgi:DNA primase